MAAPKALAHCAEGAGPLRRRRRPDAPKALAGPLRRRRWPNAPSARGLRPHQLLPLQLSTPGGRGWGPIFPFTSCGFSQQKQSREVAQHAVSRVVGVEVATKDEVERPGWAPPPPPPPPRHLRHLRHLPPPPPPPPPLPPSPLKPRPLPPARPFRCCRRLLRSTRRPQGATPPRPRPTLSHLTPAMIASRRAPP